MSYYAKTTIGQPGLGCDLSEYGVDPYGEDTATIVTKPPYAENLIIDVRYYTPAAIEELMKLIVEESKVDFVQISKTPDSILVQLSGQSAKDRLSAFLAENTEYIFSQSVARQIWFLENGGRVLSNKDEAIIELNKKILKKGYCAYVNEKGSKINIIRQDKKPRNPYDRRQKVREENDVKKEFLRKKSAQKK